MSEPVDDDLVAAILAASRAIVAIAAISIDSASVELTLQQYRALVVLRSRGPQRMSELGATMRLSRSSVSRLAERLERKGMAERRAGAADRRATELVLTADGVRVVDEVMDVRRQEIAAILAAVPVKRRATLRRAFEEFAVASGEPIRLAAPEAVLASG